MAGKKRQTVEMMPEWQRVRQRFWPQLLDYMRAQDFHLFARRKANRARHLNVPASLPGCEYHLVFNDKDVRVEIYVHLSDRRSSKRLFDMLAKHREDIESRFGHKLEWRRLDRKKGSRIRFSYQRTTSGEDDWPFLYHWFYIHAKKLSEAFDPIFEHY
ncbi:MAG: DUF4268 domain-containing protein [Candidatus Puniceispirillaceae bacterium]